MRKVVISGMIGNALEWYDFALYGYFTTIISQHFFPNTDPYVSLISTYGTFAAGFMMRPFGAILFGMLGDRYGRKVALTVSIIMMAIPTACIGLLPTYAQIGLWAPALLMVIRLFQGLSLGGEFSGSIAFIVEHSPEQRRGAAGCTTVVSLIAGMLLGSMVATLISHLVSPEALVEWGWRIPFLLGLGVGFIGFYIRHYTDESPKYTQNRDAGLLSQTPVREAITKHLKEMFQAVGMYMSVTVPFYICTVFMITYYSKILNHPFEDALIINTVVMVVLMGVVMLSGWLCDIVGRRPMLMGAAVGYLLLAYPIFWLTGSDSFWLAMLAQVIFAIILGFYIGPIPAVLVELFPTSVRYSGMAISYNICAALFGGTAPMVSTWLIRTTGDNTIVAAYIMLCAVISLITLYFYRDQFQNKLH